jgi:hypothetical protein
MKSSLLTLLLALFVTCGYCQTTVYGCMDEQALNYNPEANYDAGNCCYNNYLTTDASEENIYAIYLYTIGYFGQIYPGLSGEAGACVPDGCLQLQIAPGGIGFEDLSFFLNGETLATFTSEELYEVDGFVTLNIGTIVEGCIDQFSCNFNPLANCNDNSCTYDCLGCTDPGSFNYDPTATIDDGSCCNAANYITVTANVPSTEYFNFSIYGNNNVYYFDSYYGSSLCIPDGCYEINVAYYVADLPSQLIPITVTNANGEVLLQGELASFSGNSLPLNINSVSGCADFYACNYDPLATCFTDCVYNCFGCTDPNALNYDPTATIDDGSCCNDSYTIVSDSDVQFSWYISSANNSVSGYFPYQTSACLTDGCQTMYISSFADDPNAEINWSLLDSEGNTVVSGTVIGYGASVLFDLNAITGCTDPTACNFNAEANCSDYTLCTYDCYGCTDPEAPNYDPEALLDNGTCCTSTWYTIESNVDGIWYAYTDNGAGYASGNLSDINGFCSGSGCFSVYFYAYDYNQTDLTLNLLLDGEVVATAGWDPYVGGAMISILNGAISGCMDTYACNYDPQATCYDYSMCNYDCYGCTDASALNFDADATIDNGQCCFNSWYTVEMSGPGYWYTSSLVDYNYGHGYFPDQNGFCVDGACFQFYAWSIDGTPLTYSILDPSGNVVATGEIDNNWSNVVTVTGDGFIVGCGDAYACNYNPEATCFDNYSCDYSCYGCTNPEAPNYDPTATLDNGTCCTSNWYTVSMSEDAYWYVFDANSNSGGGIYPAQNGFCSSSTCMTMVVYTFGSSPVEYTISDESGTVVYSGIAYPFSNQFEHISFTEEIAGCMDENSCNYNPLATCESGGCNYFCGGCTNESAMNYNPNAQYDDGTCFFAAVPPTMGMAMMPDDENDQYYVIMNMSDTGNGAPYLMSSDYGVQMMMNEAGEYIAGPFPCDAEIEFTLQSLAAGMATYMNTSMEGACAIASSTEEVETELQGFLIYPNPNNGLFTISGIEATQATLRILDLSGRLVREQLINGGNQITVNTEDLNNGVYQVSILTKDGIMTERMVVKK